MGLFGFVVGDDADDGVELNQFVRPAFISISNLHVQ